MKTMNNMVKKMTKSILTAGTFACAMTLGLASCSDELDSMNSNNDVHYSEDQPDAAQTRAAQSGEYQYMTAEEIAGGQTRWGTRCRLLSVNADLTIHARLKLLHVDAGQEAFPLDAVLR